MQADQAESGPQRKMLMPTRHQLTFEQIEILISTMG
jgi:hypothetical protein